MYTHKLTSRYPFVKKLILSVYLLDEKEVYTLFFLVTITIEIDHNLNINGSPIVYSFSIRYYEIYYQAKCT